MILVEILICKKKKRSLLEKFGDCGSQEERPLITGCWLRAVSSSSGIETTNPSSSLGGFHHGYGSTLPKRATSK